MQKENKYDKEIPKLHYNHTDNPWHPEEEPQNTNNKKTSNGRTEQTDRQTDMDGWTGGRAGQDRTGRMDGWIDR